MRYAPAVSAAATCMASSKSVLGRFRADGMDERLGGATVKNPVKRTTAARATLRFISRCTM